MRPPFPGCRSAAIFLFSLAPFQPGIAQTLDKVGNIVLACDNATSCRIITAEDGAFDSQAENPVRLLMKIENGSVEGATITGFADMPPQEGLAFRLDGLPSLKDDLRLPAKAAGIGFTADLPAGLARDLFVEPGAVSVMLVDAKGTVRKTAKLSTTGLDAAYKILSYAAMTTPPEAPVVDRAEAVSVAGQPVPGIAHLRNASCSEQRKSAYEAAESDGQPAPPATRFHGWLGSRQVLWGLLCDEGFYNTRLTLAITDEDGRSPRPPAVEWPFETAFDFTNAFYNADFDQEEMKLSSYVLGRSSGDCGAEAEWVWDGTSFRLTRFAEMPYCIGIPRKDWPVLWHADIQVRQ